MRRVNLANSPQKNRGFATFVRTSNGALSLVAMIHWQKSKRQTSTQLSSAINFNSRD